MLPLILGLAAPLLKGIVTKFMDEGLNLAANAITGGGKKAKEFIEEKTGISLDDPDELTEQDILDIRKMETIPDKKIKLKQLALEHLKEENRHTEASEQNWEDIVRILSDADSANSSTRPTIAKWMAQMVGFAVIITSTALSTAIFQNNTEMIKQLSQGWPLMLAILATPTALLRAYFGMRTKEKKARYDLASSMPPKNIIDDIIGAFKKG